LGAGGPILKIWSTAGEGGRKGGRKEGRSKKKKEEEEEERKRGWSFKFST